MIDASWRDILVFAAAIAGATILAIVLYRRTSPTLPLRLRLLLGVLRWLAAALIIRWRYRAAVSRLMLAHSGQDQPLPESGQPAGTVQPAPAAPADTLSSPDAMAPLR